MSQVARFKELSVLGRETSRNIPNIQDATGHAAASLLNAEAR